MQGSNRAGELDRDVAPLLQRDQRTARDACLQQFALVEQHDCVKAGLPAGRQLDNAADPRAIDARAHPRLAHKSGAVGGNLAHLQFGKL